jgi:hypothetical protein
MALPITLRPSTRYALLALVGGLSRLIFVRSTPINWDAVQFVLALDHFDLHLHQPHPPGYILYVLLGRALLPFIADPSLALSILSALFSAAALPLIYWLVQHILEDSGAAICAALFWLASPLALYYGAVGLTYLPEAVLSMAVAGLAWKARVNPSMAIALTLGLVLGAAGGVRQTSILALGPLCVWALRGKGKGNTKQWLGFVGAFAVTCALWLVPLLALSGGVEAYLHENALLAQAVSARTSIIDAGLDGLAHNLFFETLGLVLGLCFGLIPLGLWAARTIRFSLSTTLKTFLLWWTLPTLVFYALTHVGQYGYMLVVLTPLLMLAATCVRVRAEGLAQRLHASPTLVSVAMCGVLALGSLTFFTLARGPVSAHNINANDTHAIALREALDRIDPHSTVLITTVEWEKPFRLAGYLLPPFHLYATGKDSEGTDGWLYAAYAGKSTYALPHPAAQTKLALPPNTRHVVALDEETAEMLGDKSTLNAVSLGDGSTLYMLDSATQIISHLTISEKKIKAELSDR